MPNDGYIKALGFTPKRTQDASLTGALTPTGS